MISIGIKIESDLIFRDTVPELILIVLSDIKTNKTNVLMHDIIQDFNVMHLVS